VRDLLARQLDHLGVRTEFRGRAGGGPIVPGDERRLRQVLVNLLLNAAQAMPAGGTARIRVEEVGDVARIVVEDEGGGIPDDVAARVFEPFVSARSGGTGLGLAVCRRLVEAHGGEIGFRAIEGGTAFTVSLPAR
jgi:signal transduction histidine kinase